MFELRRESVAVLKILMAVWQREEIKKRINLCETKTFEVSYDAFLREKGIQPTIKTVSRVEMDKLQRRDV
jgi:hypothetical protein